LLPSAWDNDRFPCRNRVPFCWQVIAPHFGGRPERATWR